MINKTQLEKTLLRWGYKNIRDVKNSKAIRCERSFRDKRYQTFYFDFSDNQRTFEDVSAYTRSLLGSDYFQDPGAFQWNYYLAFITENDPDPTLKHQIELDDAYARKFVVPF